MECFLRICFLLFRYPKGKSPPNEPKISPSDHVPLGSRTDVQLRFLCPDDLGEVRRVYIAYLYVKKAHLVKNVCGAYLDY